MAYYIDHFRNTNKRSNINFQATNNMEMKLPNIGLLIKQYESNFIYLAQTGHISHSMVDSMEAEYKECNIEVSESSEYFERLRREINKYQAQLKVKAQL